MKNLGWNKLANVAANNPTQTRLTRLMKLPGGEITSQVMRLKDKYDTLWRDGIKTDWDVYFGK